MTKQLPFEIMLLKCFPCALNDEGVSKSICLYRRYGKPPLPSQLI